MKLLYITAETPFGKKETFILEEMLQIRKRVDLIVSPRKPGRSVYNENAKELLGETLNVPFFSRQIFLDLISNVFTIKFWTILFEITYYSNSLKNLIKNIFVLPKSLYLSGTLKDRKITHIHAHWGTTTSTMAYIIARKLGVGFSFTVHRGDIPVNNMLQRKVEKSCFCRAINERGRNEVLDIVGREYENKVKKIFMGVNVPLEPAVKSRYGNDGDVVGLCPGRLTEVKGHKFLIEAVKMLINNGLRNFRIDIAGDGELRTELEAMIKELKVDSHVRLIGRKPHNELMEIYRKQLVDFVVLPSIVTENGDKEGIPVALMEPMAYGIPVIGTRTGGIEELLSNNSGMLIEQRDGKALAAVLEDFITREENVLEFSVNGYRRVNGDFNNSLICENLIKLFGNGGGVS